MLIGREGEPFDDKRFIYELKLDGERCLAYIDGGAVELRNKRNNRLLPKFTELADINKQVKKRCILDGELAVLVGGKPSFTTLLSRIMMSGRGLKADLAREKYPACFTAFDILYYDNRAVADKPLAERKELLRKAVKRESERLALSRFIPERGTDFFALAKENGLEGIVAKRADSLYRMGKRTTDWIKIKALQDDDFVVCGYIPKEESMNSVALGQYAGGELVYKGHVTLGASGEAFRAIKKQPRAECPFARVPKGNEGAVWIAPSLVCTVKYMHKTASGGMRQPVFKSLRADKTARECVTRQA